MKKFLALLLAALMLFGLVACAQPDGGEEETTKPSSNLEVDTGEEDYVCDLPELDFKGEEIYILYAKADARSDELVNDNTAGVVPSAVHRRNITVEDQLKIKFKYEGVGGTTVATKLTNDVQSGTHTYGIVSNGTYLSMTPALSGHYANMTELDYIDTSKHYWTQGYNDMVTFTDANMQYLASGPIAISMFRLMYLTLYNKTSFEANKVQDLYTTVKNGDWTLDYQLSILKDHWVDQDGNQQPSEGDFFGFVTGDTISVDPYVVAADLHVITKDKDTGDLVWNEGINRDMSDLCDKVQAIYNNQSTWVYKGASFDDVPYNYIIEHFAEERAMMTTTMFYKMETNYESLANLEYGIAPMPKLTKDQENYHSYVQDQVSSFGISAGARESDWDMLAATLEAMAYHSYLLVRPAYYETTLSERYMQDPQSNEVLDMIFNTLSFDFSSSCSNIFEGCVIRDNLRPVLSGNKNEISSKLSSWQKSLKRTLISYNKSLDKRKPA